MLEKYIIDVQEMLHCTYCNELFLLHLSAEEVILSAVSGFLNYNLNRVIAREQIKSTVVLYNSLHLVIPVLWVSKFLRWENEVACMHDPMHIQNDIISLDKGDLH
jgi:hypothetical protein